MEYPFLKVVMRINVEVSAYNVLSPIAGTGWQKGICREGVVYNDDNDTDGKGKMLTLSSLLSRSVCSSGATPAAWSCLGTMGARGP